MIKRYSTIQGFTLVEMAVVITIVGLLLSGVLMTLSSQRDMKDYVETRNKLALAQEAIYGYAASHVAFDGKPYLPCPDTNNDGVEDRKPAGDCTLNYGGLPVVDLGLENVDNWNNRFTYQVTPAFANSTTGFTLADAGALSVRQTAGGAAVATQLPAVILSWGKNGSIAPTAGSDEAENRDNDTIFVDKEMMPDFDDEVVWISLPILVNRMVQATRLP